MIKIYGVGVSDVDERFNKGTIKAAFRQWWFLNKFIGLEPMIYCNTHVEEFEDINFGFLLGFQIYFKKQKE